MESVVAGAAVIVAPVGKWTGRGMRGQDNPRLESDPKRTPLPALTHRRTNRARSGGDPARVGALVVELCDDEGTSAPGRSRPLLPRRSRFLTNGRDHDHLVPRGARSSAIVAGQCQMPPPVMSVGWVSTANAQCAEQPRLRCGCGHPRDEHDQVAVRYCAATASNQLHRGCICMTPAPAPTDVRAVACPPADAVGLPGRHR